MWICSAARPGADPVVVQSLPPSDRQCFENYFLHGRHSAHFDAVLAKLRQHHLWLMCGCRALLKNGQPDPAQAPLFFPRKIDDRIRLVRNTARPPHHDSCPFYFDPPDTNRHVVDRMIDGPPCQPLECALILRNSNNAARSAGSLDEIYEKQSQLPKIARLLWSIMDWAELNVIRLDAHDKVHSGGADNVSCRSTIRSEIAKLRSALANIHAYTDHMGFRHSLLEINKTYAPALVRPVGGSSEIYQLFCTHAGKMVKVKKRPQVYFFGYVNDVAEESIDHPDLPEDFHIGTTIKKLSVAEQSVSPPYLAAIVFGQRADTRRFSAIQAFAQPIYEAQHDFAQFVPVTSAFERQCLRMLKSLQFVLMREHSRADVVIRKPLFTIPTPAGHCLPDFILDITVPAGKRLSFGVEMLGTRPSRHHCTEQAAEDRLRHIGPVLTVEPEDVIEHAYRSKRDRFINQILSAFRSEPRHCRDPV
jgi:hypothetical protein